MDEFPTFDLTSAPPDAVTVDRVALGASGHFVLTATDPESGGLVRLLLTREQVHFLGDEIAVAVR